MKTHVGLNPYGLTYHLGLQGRDTPRANPKGRGVRGLIDIAIEIGAETLEVFQPWLAEMSDDELHSLRDEAKDLGMKVVVSSGLMLGDFQSSMRSAIELETDLMRFGLTRVLCGDRNAKGAEWPKMVAEVSRQLKEYAPIAADKGVTLAIENHQDFGSQELVDFCDEAGPNVGICFDMGNTFPVAESPLDFTRRVAHKVKYLHLKDYTPQFTPEGYRLVRCAIGDGAVPHKEMIAIIGEHNDSMHAALEPGALDMRNVRLLTPDWWNGYKEKNATDLAACMAAAWVNHLPEDADYRTPWEREDDDVLEEYELAMIRRSADNMKSQGIMRTGDK